MIRRTLFLFGTFALASLAVPLGYVVFFVDGARDVLHTAQEHFERGEYLRVVADLDLNERSPSLSGDPAKRHMLWSLRYRAHLALRNHPAALRDLERLLADQPSPDETLVLDHIRLLALNDRGEQARADALAFVAEHADHPAGLELAGEACQTAYREELRAVRAAIELDLGAAVVRETAMPALLAFLYRPDNDTDGQVIEPLRKAYAAQSMTVAAWPTMRQRLGRLRARIQEALGLFQRSLEAGGEPVAAFRGLALSLEQAGRLDDLLTLCESYRRTFDHQYVIEAGATAAWALLGAGLDDATRAAAQRWLPPDAVARLAATSNPAVAAADLLLARAVAAWNARDAAELQRVFRDAFALRVTGPAVRLPQAVANGLHQWLRDDDNCLRALAWATGLATRSPTRHGQQDLLAILLPAQIDWMRRHGHADAEINELFLQWQRARPTAAEPRLALAAWQLDAGDFAGAMATLNAAEKSSPGDETLLALRVRAAAEIYRSSDQDGPGLLQQCIDRQELLPDVPHPVCYLLCGEAALVTGAAPIALACARAATDAMPWSRAGRRLEVEALLEGGRTTDALALLRDLVAAGPRDPATLQLALRAFATSGEPTTEVLWLALRELGVSSELLAEILRAAGDSAPANALPFARRVLTLPDATVGARVLAAAAFARAGDQATAERTLQALSAEQLALPEHRAAVAAAVTSLVRRAAAAAEPDAQLAARTSSLLAEHSLACPAAVPELFACARDLEETHPASAWLLVTTALAAAAPEDRSGAAFALAARLALRQGRFALFEQHATAALAFDDGRTVAEQLVRLCLATGRTERAGQVYRLAAPPTDGALALRFGAPASGEQLATAVLVRDPGDLLAQATLTAAGKRSLTEDLVPTDDAERETLLELAAVLRTPELAPQVLSRAARYAEVKQTPSARLLLARACFLSGEAAEAGQIHLALWREGLDTLPFWREVAEGSCFPGYAIPPILLQAFATAAASGKLELLPFAFAVATMRTADRVQAGGLAPVLVAQLRASVWRRYDPARPFPAHCIPSLADIDTLAVTGRPLDTWTVLERILPTLREPDRADCLARMLAIARAGDALAAHELLALDATILKLAATERPHGSIVHYLLGPGAAYRGQPLEAARANALLEGHLQLVATGLDPADRLPETVACLVERRGLAGTLAAVEATLRAHPGALPLWRQRARLLTQMHRAGEGIADLRSVLAHAVAPELRLACTTLAAAHYALTEADIRELGQSEPALLQTPQGLFARGLTALRTGVPDQAVDLLARAAPEGGTLRLLTLAQALLQSDTEDAVARAVATLQQLAAEHPTAAEARYASCFVRMLTAPRPE